jgi:SnoaL-like domain
MTVPWSSVSAGRGAVGISPRGWRLVRELVALTDPALVAGAAAVGVKTNVGKPVLTTLASRLRWHSPMPRPPATARSPTRSGSKISDVGADERSRRTVIWSERVESLVVEMTAEKEPEMDPVQQLIEIEAIKQLKYRYQRCADLHDWSGLAECFADDAVCAYGDGAYTFEGRDQIIGFLRSLMDRDGLKSSHHVHHPEITLTSETTAAGVWALHDVAIDLDKDFLYEGAAYYHDRYVKVDGHWRIAHTGYKRVWEQYQQPRSSAGWKLGMPEL